MYERVVGEGGVAPDYFMYKMTFREIEAFLTGFYRRHSEAWEQTRIIGYIIAQANSTKKLELTDILRFPWDSENTEIKDTSVSDEDMKRLREMAKQMEQTL